MEGLERCTDVERSIQVRSTVCLFVCLFVCLLTIHISRGYQIGESLAHKLFYILILWFSRPEPLYTPGSVALFWRHLSVFHLHHMFLILCELPAEHFTYACLLRALLVRQTEPLDDDSHWNRHQQAWQEDNSRRYKLPNGVYRVNVPVAHSPNDDHSLPTWLHYGVEPLCLSPGNCTVRVLGGDVVVSCSGVVVQDHRELVLSEVE